MLIKAVDYQNGSNLQGTIDTYLSEAGGLLGGLTILGCMFGCCAVCCAKFANRPCKGWFVKCQVFWSFGAFLTFAIIWFIIGAALSVPYNLGGQFFDDQCKYAIEKNEAK